MKRLLSVLFIVCFASLGYGRQIDPVKDRIEVLNDFSGGLNTQKAAHKLPKNQTPSAENGLIDEKPESIIKRAGFITAGTVPSQYNFSKISLMKPFVLDNGVSGMFISDSSQVLFTKDFTTYVLVKSTLTTNAKLRAVQGRGFMLFTNGIDPVFISSGLVGLPLDGTNGRVNVPRGTYPAYYQEKFWVYGTTNSCSELLFQALTSTDGFVIGIDDPRSWPVLNQMNIGRGDGSCGSGLDVFKGQLQAHKSNNSIYTIFGTDEFSYQARRTNAHSGTAAADSIVQGDNLEYYFSKDGVHAFDGGNSVRISDDILPDMQAVASNLTSIQNVTWDTRSDFERGLLLNTTTTADGFLTINSTVIVNGIGTTYGGSGATTLTFPTTSTIYHAVSTDSVAAGLNFSGFISSFTIWGKQAGTCGFDVNIYFSFINKRTGQVVYTSTHCFQETGSTAMKFSFASTNTLNLTASDLQAGRIAVKASMNNPSAASCGYEVSSFTVSSKYFGGLQGSEMKITTNAANFVSEVTTATGITLWDNLDSVYYSNGGAVRFFVRGATSPVNITTETWTSIIPGNLIPLPVAKSYLQWASSFSSVGVEVTTGVRIDSVIEKWNQGGASDSAPFGVSWKKRYWLAVATQPSATSSIIYVKSKITNPTPNAWMKFTGFYIKSFAILNDTLYAGSGNSGTIYRMDYGTNDNGTAISWFYDTPDMTFGDNFFEKRVYTYLIDAQRESGATLSIGTSREGSAFSYNSVSLNGTGRLLYPIENVPYPFGKYYRFRFANSELDKSITFNGFGVVHQPTIVVQPQGQ